MHWRDAWSVLRRGLPAQGLSVTGFTSLEITVSGRNQQSQGGLLAGEFATVVYKGGDIRCVIMGDTPYDLREK